MLCNTAVFYDIENLIGLFSTKNNTVLQLDEIYRRILETEGVSGVSIQKAYTDWGVQLNRNLRNYVLQIGIEPVQIFNTNQNDKVKNASDVSLIIDAVDLIQKRPDIENYVIVSGDGIFAFLAKKLHEYGKRVIGVGFLRNSNVIFRNACDYYISLEKDDKSLTATTNKSALKGQSAMAQAAEQAQSMLTLVLPEAGQELVKSDEPTAVSPVAAVKQPIKRKFPASFPKSKFTDILAKSDFPAWHKQPGENNLNGGLLAIRNLINILFENNASADLEISVFKIYVDYYVPGFKVSQYKFKRFGEFMRFVVTGSPFCLFMHDSTILKVTRRGMVGNKGKLMDDYEGLSFNLSDGQKLTSLFDVPDGMAFTFYIPPAAFAPAKPAAKAVIEALVNENVPEAAALETRKPEAAELLDAPASEVSAAVPVEEVAKDFDALDINSVRKMIKASFTKMMLGNRLSPAECNLRLTQEYSFSTFGVKAPIFRELLTRANLQEQRLINGKVRYWKEVFKFNNKMYLVFKEWSAAVHKDRFLDWLKEHE